MKQLLTNEDYYNHFRYMLRHPSCDTVYHIYEEDAIHYGDENDCNLEATKGKIKTYKINRLGGCIVCRRNDISFFHIGKNDHCGIKWNKFILAKLHEKGIDARVENNDITIHGKKFMGSCGRELGEYNLFAAHINILPWKDGIKDYCLKINREPTGLALYGINEKIVEQWLKEFSLYYL